MNNKWMRAVILAAFAFLIVFLDRTNQLTLYIAPRMDLYVKLSALGLYIAAVHQFYTAFTSKKPAHACDCGDDHHHGHGHAKRFGIKSAVVYGLFLLPLALGFLTPTGVLASEAAAKKGMSFTGSESIPRIDAAIAAAASQEPVPSELPASEPAVESAPNVETSSNSSEQLGNEGNAPGDSLESKFPSDEYTIDHAKYGMKLYEQPLITVPEKQYIETLTTLDLYRNNFVGKKIEISGFIYKESDMAANHFAVSRFAMNCCSADALPYGLMVHWDRAAEYSEDEWVNVIGTLGSTLYNENEIMVLEVEQIERITAPDSPYVYPDFEFGL